MFFSFFDYLLEENFPNYDIFVFGVSLEILTLYVLLKDSLPFFNSQSIGKKIIRIKVVNYKTGESITGKYLKSIICEFFQFVPIINFIDVLAVFSNTQQHLEDKLTDSHTIKT